MLTINFAQLWDLTTLDASASTARVTADMPPSSSSTPPIIIIDPTVTVHPANPGDDFLWTTATPTGTQLVTHGLLSDKLDLWDIKRFLDKLKKSPRSIYDDKNLYSPSRSISNERPPTAVCYGNGCLATGDTCGTLRLISFQTGECLQRFSDHKGPVTDIYVVSYDLTCMYVIIHVCW